MVDVTSDTTWLLEQWARWSKINHSVGYPSVQPFTKLLGNTLPSPVINDNQALEIDNAVTMLTNRDKEMGHAVILYYFSGNNLSKAARVLNIDRHRANVLVKSGTAWIDAIVGYAKAA